MYTVNKTEQKLLLLKAYRFIFYFVLFFNLDFFYWIINKHIIFWLFTIKMMNRYKVNEMK
jgi:hypothetical protein